MMSFECAKIKESITRLYSGRLLEMREPLNFSNIIFHHVFILTLVKDDSTVLK